MKRWKRFEGYLTNGDWHVHTNYTDGSGSVSEMCEYAEKNKLQLIAFAEHVWKKPLYDFSDLVRDVEEARRKFPGLKILVGCETRILPDGDLDVSGDVLEQCDLVVASFHNFVPVKEDQINALKKVLENPEVDVWGHPATMLSNLSLSEDEMLEIINLCIKNNVLIEKNLHYGTPPEFLKLVERLGAKTVTSSDAHNVWDIRKI